MTAVTVGKWGKNLAIRVPAAVAETIGPSRGDAYPWGATRVLARDLGLTAT
jgi:hypothetical protein